DALVKGTTMLQNQLHGQLMYHYPSYRKFFCLVNSKTALYFWETYPSPRHLQAVTAETLADGLRSVSRNACSMEKAQTILDLVAADGDTHREFQAERDFIVKSIIQELRYKQQAIEGIDGELKTLLPLTGYKLDTMPGINLNTASHIISEIGDINRFPTSDKLARFAGIAPVLFSSAGKGKEQRSRQGNRVLHGIFYFLAVQLVQVSKGG
ncbi:transposase, partial [Acetonema longum]